MGTVVEMKKVSRKWEIYPWGKLEDVSLSLYEGEMLCALGGIRAGIYLLPPLILGVMHPHIGSIRVFGSFPGTSETLRKIAYHPHRFRPPASQTLSQWLSLMLAIYRIPDPTKRLRIWLKEMGLDKWKNRPLNVFPRDVQIDVALRSLDLLEPELFLLEMPFEDASTERFSLWMEWLNSLLSRKVSVLLIGHQEGEFERRLNPNTLFFRNGRVIWRGQYADLDRDFSCSVIEVDEVPGEVRKDLPILFVDSQPAGVFLHCWKSEEEKVVQQLEEWMIPIRSILPYQAILREMIFP